MFLKRLNEDAQYAWVKHEGQIFMSFRASTWDNETFVPYLLTPSVRQIKIHVRQVFTESNTNNYKNRVIGFRIATPELLEWSSSGEDLFKVSAIS